MQSDPILTLRKDLSSINLKPNRLKGQNFLIDRGIRSALLRAGDVGPGDDVIEIGAGTGIITYELAGKANSVLAVEYDSTLYAFLKAKFEDQDHVSFIQADGARWISDYLASAGSSSLKFVSSLPYGITSPVFAALVQFKSQLQKAAVIIQKEVAERIIAVPGNSNRSALSVIAQSGFDLKLIRTIPARRFFPVPGVESALLELIPRADIASVNYADLSSMVRLCFSQKRKTLMNNLKQKYPSEMILDILTDLKINERLRAETLGVDDFYRLTERFERKGR
jgi:16S rRNA (adenine1518-N6/adenine1519-N6)-dimethyltransferase